MARPARITRFDGAVLADTLFLVGQAWVKRRPGMWTAGLRISSAAMKLVPPDSVRAIMGLIEAGVLPEPGPDPEADGCVA